jgi:fumarate reductase flavoprotein subunit
MKQMEADVIVAAAGTAGLPAAVAAAAGGARVIVFEKAATTGGAGNMAYGPFAVESRLQHMKQEPTTREEAFKILMDYTHWRVDARLVSSFINKTADTIDWLEKMGVEFLELGCHNPGFPYTWHIVKGSAFGGAMMKVLTDRAQEMGAQIMLRTPVKKILKEGGRVTGVVAEDENGEEIRASAKAVIICTGGFSDNPEMVKKYTGYDMEGNLFGVRVPGVTGDGIRMAWESGAAPTQMVMHLTIIASPKLGEEVYPYIFHKPILIVNQKGERFMNEEINMDNPTFVANAISRQKGGYAFAVFDEATLDYYRGNKLDYPHDGVVAVRQTAPLDTDIKPALDREPENVFAADTLDELADKAGIDAENLKNTVAEYNAACETGRDDLFHKKARYLSPVKAPRYYAGKLFPGMVGSMGGIKINYKGEALDKNDDVIPGLYAGGLDANSIYADSYAFVLPGGTMGFAVNSGRIAGESAADYVKTI